jgi:ribose-phosphate pyrophosphokinase
MISAIPEQIGILSCPGAAGFAAKLTADLEEVAQRKFRRKVAYLSQKYGISREEIIRRVNLTMDLRPTTADINLPIDQFRISSLKVPVQFTRFANGEYKSEILTSVRNMDVYIVQDVENHYPIPMNRGDAETYQLSVNDHFFCLLVTVDAAMQAGAKRVTVVLPTYPYARQHKKQGREGLTAARLGQFLEFAGVQRIITLDVHSKEIDNTFNRLRLEDLHASYQILRALSDIADLQSPDLVIIAPDTGSIVRNKFYANALSKSLGMLYKERDYSRISKDARHNNITNVRLLGSVQGKTVFMADDMLGTGGTMLRAMSALKNMGAERIICAASLPFFSGNAIETYEEAYREGLFYRFIGTNAVYHDRSLLGREWYISTDITYLFARAIHRLHADRSVSSLLDNKKIIQSMLEKSKTRRLEGEEGGV